MSTEKRLVAISADNYFLKLPRGTGTSAPGWRGSAPPNRPAWGAEVVSSNTVGYKKITLAGHNYNMLSPMFQKVGGGDKKITDLFTDNDAFLSGGSDSEADFIYLWYDGGYQEKYFFSADADDKWSSDQDGFDETTDVMPENAGFWLYNRDDEKEVIVAGEVPTGDIEIDVVGYNYTMVANPFSAAIPVKSIVAAEGEFVSGGSDSEADYIYIWRNGAYDTKYFVSSDADDKWSSDQDGFDETEDTIGPAEAFWFYRRGAAMKIKIPAPYTLQ